jgi:glycosyltransferase involved in cell wall biosynthesis
VFVASRLPWPLNDGWNRRTFHIVHALARRWPVQLIVFHAGAEHELQAARQAFGGAVQIETVQPRAFRRLRGLLRSAVGPRSYLTTVDDDPRLQQAVNRAMSTGHVVLWGCAGAFLAGYMPARHTGDGRLVRFIDTHNIDSVVAERYRPFLRNPLKRWFATRTAAQLLASERRAFTDADAVFVCSDQEIADVRARAPTAWVRTIANGVDTVSFSVRAHVPTGTAPTLLFFGRLDYFPNVDAIRFLTESILAPLLRLVPDVRIRIVGAGSSEEIRALTRSFACVEVVGQVADMNEELARAHAVIIPLRVGGGTRLKVVETMAAGRPMVSTSIGAEGIDVVDGVHAMLRDDASAFATATAALLSDAERARRMGAAARVLAEGSYSWDAIGAQLRSALESLLADSRR